MLASRTWVQLVQPSAAGAAVQRSAPRGSLNTRDLTPSICALIRPPQQRRPHRKTRSNRCQQYQASLLEPSLLARRFHGERDRASRGVAVTIDVDDDAFRTHVQAISRGSDD